MEQPAVKTELRDALNRPLHDLRISVIDKCNLRCTYCMPEEQYHERYKFLPAEERLSFDEIEQVTRAFVSLGVSKVRITGGEPLLRRDLPDLVGRLSAIDGVDDLALTTNGLLLPRYAGSLKDAGLTRLTVSLDTLDDEIAGVMNGRGKGAGEILEGIEAAEQAGFEAIKINVVVQRGVNDHTVLDLVERFRGTGHILRFIEYMDVGNRNHWRSADVVPSQEILKAIHAKYALSPEEENYHGEVADRYTFADGQGEIGFISSVTEPFCGTCTRARVSADGKVFTCLFASEGADLRGPLREGATGDDIVELVTSIWRNRKDRYSELRAELAERQTRKVEMYQIGG